MIPSKKGDATVGIIILIIIIILIVWLVNLGYRECSTDKQCGSEAYCGVDHNCHTIPVIERTVVKQEYNLVPAATFIGIAIIIAAIILKWKTKPGRLIDEYRKLHN